MLYFLDSNCKSKLRILRLASTHYRTLRSFLHAVYVARNSHLKILKLEQTLLNGDISALIDASSVSFDNLFSTVEEHVQDISNLEKPDLEMRLRVHNAEVFTDYQKAVDDYPENVCCSCQQLHQKKNVTVVRFDDHLGTTVWPLLKDCLLKRDASAADDMHFMCIIQDNCGSCTCAVSQSGISV